MDANRITAATDDGREVSFIRVHRLASGLFVPIHDS
jgi:hypothetical protein